MRRPCRRPGRCRHRGRSRAGRASSAGVVEEPVRALIRCRRRQVSRSRHPGSPASSRRSSRSAASSPLSSGRTGAAPGPGLALGGERGVGGAEALDPARLVEVGDDEGVAAAAAEAEVEAEGVAGGPVERIVAEQLARPRELGGDDRRALGRQRVERVAGLDLDAELAHAALQRRSARPSRRSGSGRRRRAEQDPHRVPPDEGRRELAGVVVERVDAGRGGQHLGGALVAVRGAQLRKSMSTGASRPRSRSTEGIVPSGGVRRALPRQRKRTPESGGPA